MKKVSVVVPLYNSEKYLHKLLDSLVNQTYKNIEIVLVDDGSPDNSGVIADQYKLSDGRIKVIHKLNGGTCEARNVGIQNSSGDYLMFADGDDWLEINCIQYLVSLIEDNEAEMAMTDSIFTTRDRTQNIDENIRVWSNTEAVAGIINTFIIPVGPWNKLYSMKVIRDNNISFSVAWFGEGLYFSTIAAQYSKKIAVGHKKIYNYRLNNPNSGCTKREVKNAISSLNNILFIRDNLVISSEGITSALNWHIWRNNFNLITYIVGSGEKGDYIERYKISKKELKRLLPYVLKHRELPRKNKVRIVLSTYFPRFIASYSIKKSNKAFSKDIME